MRAIQFNRFGNPAEVLELVDHDPGSPDPGEALIRVEATPIHPSDLLTVSGEYGLLPPLPATPGNEGVGRVVEVGRDVVNVKTGDLVLLPLGSGTWCEGMRASANELVALPDSADPVQMSMMSINPLTAELLLTEFVDLHAGDWVIQNAANSSVGHYLVTLARQRGVKTINIVRRGGGVAMQVQELGGTEVIVDQGQDIPAAVKAIVGGDPVRLAIDAVGGDSTSILTRCLSPGATLVNYGRMAGKPCLVDPGQLIFRDIRVQGFWLLNWFREHGRDAVLQRLQALAQQFTAGHLRAEIAGTYPLERFKDAVKQAQQHSRDGKVVLTPEAHW